MTKQAIKDLAALGFTAAEIAEELDVALYVVYNTLRSTSNFDPELNDRIAAYISSGGVRDYGVISSTFECTIKQAVSGYNHWLKQELESITTRMSVKDLARDYGVSTSLIYKLCPKRVYTLEDSEWEALLDDIEAGHITKSDAASKHHVSRTTINKRLRERLFKASVDATKRFVP